MILSSNLSHARSPELAGVLPSPNDIVSTRVNLGVRDADQLKPIVPSRDNLLPDLADSRCSHTGTHPAWLSDRTGVDKSLRLRTNPQLWITLCVFERPSCM